LALDHNIRACPSDSAPVFLIDGIKTPRYYKIKVPENCGSRSSRSITLVAVAAEVLGPVIELREKFLGLSVSFDLAELRTQDLNVDLVLFEEGWLELEQGGYALGDRIDSSQGVRDDEVIVFQMGRGLDQTDVLHIVLQRRDGLYNSIHSKNVACAVHSKGLDVHVNDTFFACFEELVQDHMVLSTDDWRLKDVDLMALDFEGIVAEETSDAVVGLDDFSLGVTVA
jgi:hypothetical protein